MMHYTVYMVCIWFLHLPVNILEDPRYILDSNIRHVAT
jgi:hypothetical protein